MNQKIIDCTLKVIENQKNECLWNDKLTQQEDFESFQAVLMERSEIIRKYYKENEILLQTMREYAKEPMDEERADTLFEAARQTILSGRLDLPLTMLLAKNLIDYYYNNVEEVLAHKEDLLEIIRHGARLHDAGKCSIASVIMTQSRKLTDDEFFLIKSHPSRGYDFFKGTEGFEVYADIIRGHHKNYDGKWGYPADFDNTASPYRILIDLISISDSADAATDTLGRNYAVGKDFYRLLGELKEGAGSRYNPDIVRIISNSPELVERLAELSGSLRIQYCYEAYRQCIQLR